MYIDIYLYVSYTKHQLGLLGCGPWPRAKPCTCTVHMYIYIYIWCWPTGHGLGQKHVDISFSLSLSLFLSRSFSLALSRSKSEYICVCIYICIHIFIIYNIKYKTTDRDALFFSLCTYRRAQCRLVWLFKVDSEHLPRDPPRRCVLNAVL